MATAAISGGAGEVVKLVFACGVWAEIVGVTVAWFRLRRTDVWVDRDRSVSSLRLLSDYVGTVTALVIGWSLAVVVVALLVSAVS
jgi:hypothetical protein